MTPAPKGQSPGPVIRHAPLGELRIYTVTEHELDAVARGSPASLFLNFALALLPIAVTLFATLATTTIPSDRLYTFFVCACLISLVSGLVLLALWWREHASAKKIVEQIKNRMPPPPGVRETDSR